MNPNRLRHWGFSFDVLAKLLYDFYFLLHISVALLCVARKAKHRLFQSECQRFGKMLGILNLGFMEKTKNTPIIRAAEANAPKSEARIILFL